MVEVAANGDPAFEQAEDENLSDTERFELDDFTLISSELAQDVEDGPAEKSDSDDALPSPPKKDLKKKKRKSKPKKPHNEPDAEDVVVPHDTSSQNSDAEASVEVPEKHKKERKRLKRTRSDSEEEYDADDIDTPKKRKDKSRDDDEDDDRPERRKRSTRTDKRRGEDLESVNIKKTKEKTKDRTEKEVPMKEKREETDEPASEATDSEPEDTEVVPVSTFLSEFRPSVSLVADDTIPKRRSKFGESILSKRPTSPKIIPFERPRIKPPSLPPPQPQNSQPSHTSQPSEPNGNHSTSQNLSHLQSQTQSPPSYPDPLAFQDQQWGSIMEQQQLELQQQLMQQHLQQQQLHTYSSHSADPSSTQSHSKSHHKHKKHTKDKDKEKREREKREKEKRHKREKEKREKEKHKKKEKAKKLDPTTPEYAAKRKAFKLKLSETVGLRLKKYLRANRIATKEDFKHLARKFTHKIMDSEDAKAVFVIKPNTEEKIHKVIDAYFERHNTYSRSDSSTQPGAIPDASPSHATTSQPASDDQPSDFPNIAGDVSLL